LSDPTLHVLRGLVLDGWRHIYALRVAIPLDTLVAGFLSIALELRKPTWLAAELAPGALLSGNMTVDARRLALNLAGASHFPDMPDLVSHLWSQDPAFVVAWLLMRPCRLLVR